MRHCLDGNHAEIKARDQLIARLTTAGRAVRGKPVRAELNSNGITVYGPRGRLDVSWISLQRDAECPLLNAIGDVIEMERVA